MCSIFAYRRAVLTALWAIDGLIFDDSLRDGKAERAADNLSSQLQPDLFVKGDIYSIDIPKASLMRSSSGKIYLIQVEIPTSTTAIIQQIIDSSKK